MCIRDSVRRTRTSYTSKIKDEVLVIFDTVSSRDYIFSHAKNLGKIPKESRLLRGLRLDYPAHLGSDYRALDMYGAKLKGKFGDGFRRNMRFDDDIQGLYMDIFLPASKEWVRVSANMAKEERNVLNEFNETESRKKIQDGLRLSSILTGANALPVVPAQEEALRDIWNAPTTSTPMQK